MNKVLSVLSGSIMACALPSVSHAADADPLSFNVSLTSDYRYRGISQTRLKPALQGGVDYAHASGFYVGAWGSTIKWIKDAGRISGVDSGSANVEIDLYGGYKGEIQKGLGYDVGVLQYWYPRNHYKNVSHENANTTEVYGALSFGPATLKYSHAVTPLFGATDSKNSGYLDASASFEVGRGFSVTPHVGYQHVAKNSEASYTDVALTVSKDVAGFGLSAAVVATDTKDSNGYSYYSPGNKNLGRTALVVSVKKTF